MSIDRDEVVEIIPARGVHRSVWVNRWLPLLLRNIRFIAIVVTLAALVGIALAFLLPVRYESEARLVTSESNGTSKLLKSLGGIGDAAALAGYTSSELGGDSNTGRFIGILRSRTAADHVIDQLDLMKVYGARKREIARRILEQNTSIAEERKTDQIVLRVTDHDAQRAQKLTRAYIDELNALNAQLNTTEAHREREFLEQRIREVNDELQTAAQKLSKFSQKTSVMAVGDQEKAMFESVAKLQTELIQARTQLSGLEQIYSDDYYMTRQARARIATLNKELQALRGTDASGDKEGMFPSINQLPDLVVTYSDLYKRAKILEVSSEVLNRQLELVKTDEVKELPVIRVLDEPEVPGSKSWPPRKLILLIAVLAGFTGAIAWVITRQVWDDLSPDHDFKVAWATVRTWQAEKRWRRHKLTNGKD